VSAATTKGERKLGAYHLGAKIGHGGMAVVFVAAHEDRPGRPVALKCIHPRFAVDETFRAMFADEGKTLSRVQHPNVLKLLEHHAGDDEEVPFMAVELLFGHTLAELMERMSERGEKMRPDLAAGVVRRIASGLHVAHELRDDNGEPEGIVHRDVNPTNIFVTLDGDVKLIDFGLAKVHKPKRKTQTGIIKGKYAYLAPEHIEGKPADRLIDVFALGITLWEAIASERLFRRDNDITTLEAVKACIVPSLSERNPACEKTLELVANQALARNPSARFQTALELSEALAPYEPDDFDQGLQELSERLFPDARQSFADWIRSVAQNKNVKVPDHTVRPPAPIPVGQVDGPALHVPRLSSRPPPGFEMPASDRSPGDNASKVAPTGGPATPAPPPFPVGAWFTAAAITLLLLALLLLVVPALTSVLRP
jgi:serine/threonine-protein kinase